MSTSKPEFIIPRHRLQQAPHLYAFAETAERHPDLVLRALGRGATRAAILSAHSLNPVLPERERSVLNAISDVLKHRALEGVSFDSDTADAAIEEARKDTDTDPTLLRLRVFTEKTARYLNSQAPESFAVTSEEIA